MKKTMRIFLPLLAAGLVLFAGCESPVDPGSGPGKGEGTVTGVSVSPANVELEKGKTFQFAATVTGTGDYPKAVTWAVSGGGAGTSISGGLLTVAADETAESLTVTAASTADPSKKGSVTVTLVSAGIPADALVLYVSEEGDDGAGDGSEESPFMTVKKALAELKAIYAADFDWPDRQTEQAAKAYILIDGLVEETGANTSVNGQEEATSTIAISSTQANAWKEWPPVELRGRSGDRPGELVAQSGKRVLCVYYNSVTLGPNLTLSGGQITTNGRNGGGVYAGSGSRLVLDGVAITGNSVANSAGYGGGVMILGASGAGQDARLAMRRGTISENTATSSAAAGGGVYTGNNASFTMTGGAITGNAANATGTGTGAGGGVFIASANASFTITGGGISGNTVVNNSTSGTNVTGGNGVYTSAATSVFKLGGTARIATDNEVRLFASSSANAKILLVAPFGGPAGTVAKIDFAANPTPELTWRGRPVLVWDDGQGGPYPADRFEMGCFRLGSATTGTNDPATAYEIDGAAGILTTKEALVTGVSVSPAQTLIQTGGSAVFTATVTGLKSPPATVTWSVSGNSSGSTAIDGGGALTVGGDEASQTLTITATSTYDGSKKGTATVTVKSGQVWRWHVSATGNDGSGNGSEANPYATVTKALTEIKTLYAANKAQWPAGDAGAVTIIISGTINHPIHDVDDGSGYKNSAILIDGISSSRAYPPLILEGDPGSPGTLQPGSSDARVLRLRYAKLTLGPHLTLTGGGFTTGSASSNIGGGIYFISSSELILDGATITGNGSALTFGGGVATKDAAGGSSTLRIRSGVISNNTSAGQGGGVSIQGVISGTGPVFEMTGGSIINNAVDTTSGPSNGGGGSAIYLFRKLTATITGGTITGNTHSPFGYESGTIRIGDNASCILSLGGTVNIGAGLDIFMRPTITGITLLDNLSGWSGPITLNLGSPGSATASWIDFPLLKGLSSYPAGKFILGHYVNCNMSAGGWEDVAVPITGKIIDPATGKLDFAD